jgi:oxygen-independent coproporphyrinogen-3 oxidase
LDVHRAGKLTEPFCAALAQEMRAAGEVVRRSGKRVVSVYWGGGTPTALSAEQLDRLLGTLAERFDLRDVREHTVEAGRPDTITAEKLGVLRAHGVTRVSVNPQTMDDGILEGIGRRHTAAQTLEAVELVRAAGCFTLNMDLIAGLPGDDPQTFLRGLAGVLDCRPGNVTVHTLARKNGARITTGAEALPEPAAVGAMLDGASARLRAAGYGPYYLYRQKYMAASRENVGWSLPGAECLYNLLIMEELRTVLALGAGGSTKLVYPAENRIERVFNPKYAKEYIDAIDTVARRKEGIF